MSLSKDKLGLDRIYIQAELKANNVGRPEVQSFVGALAGAGKGVFITTISFTTQAWEYIKTIKDKDRGSSWSMVPASSR